jgi:phosphoribosylformylglycinamidine cyclo-ligase
VHKSYLRPVSALLESVKVRGMAHITGGGLYDNIPRILPQNCRVMIDSGSWKVPHVFAYMQEKGRVDIDEMYRVFNMGIGYTVILRQKNVTAAMNILKKLRQKPVIIGEITKGTKSVNCIN